MARSFQLVDHKVAETEFFLCRIPECEFDFFAAQCYTNAFTYSARNITFAIQSVVSDTAGFKQWYQEVQEQLKGNNLAKFFNEYRRVSTHIGEQLVGGGAFHVADNGEQVIAYFFRPNQDLQVVPQDDVLSLCSEYFTDLLRLVFDCYEKFKYIIDAKWYYTSENFEKLGKTIEDAEQELGFPRGWTDIGEPSMMEKRWKLLRSRALGCEINHIFKRYLGKTFLQPE
jgi:hypothetical protein